VRGNVENWEKLVKEWKKMLETNILFSTIKHLILLQEFMGVMLW
jgi:hypothetical protein